MGRLYKLYIASYTMNTPAWERYLSAAGELFNCPQIQSLEQFEQHFVFNRLQHIRSVAFISFVIAERLGLDAVGTARAATMHDLFYYDWRESDPSHRLHGYRHPGSALKNAYHLCGVLTPKEKDIIRHHMFPLTPVPPRSAEGWIVSAVDKYCAAIEVYYSSSEKHRDKFYKTAGLD